MFRRKQAQHFFLSCFCPLRFIPLDNQQHHTAKLRTRSAYRRCCGGVGSDVFCVRACACVCVRLPSDVSRAYGEQCALLVWLGPTRACVGRCVRGVVRGFSEANKGRRWLITSRCGRRSALLRNASLRRFLLRLLTTCVFLPFFFFGWPLLLRSMCRLPTGLVGHSLFVVLVSAPAAQWQGNCGQKGAL